MINGKLKRLGSNTEQLEAEIDDYFDSNDEYSIEMLYMHLGVRKHDIYNGKNQSQNPDHVVWANLINDAKDAIHNDLAHEIKQSDKMPQAKLLYLRNRFKDDMLEEKSNDEKVVINIGNEGPNALLGNKDA